MDGNGAPSRNRRADAGELGVRFRLAQPKVFGGIEKRVDGLYRHAGVQFKGKRLRTLRVCVEVIGGRKAPPAVFGDETVVAQMVVRV